MWLAPGGDPYGAARGRVAQGVLDEHIEDAVEIRRRAPRHAGAGGARLDLLPAIRCGGRPAGRGALRRRPELHELAWEFPLPGAAEHEQLLDHPGEAIDLRDRGVELGCARRLGAQARLLEAQAQARQRCAQLV
jgi:hypothetical protein